MFNENGKNYTAIGLLLGIAIIGFISILLATSWGAGVTPDATFYLQGAQNIADGLGYVWIDFCSGACKAITHWPPLFPFILSLGTHLDLEPLAGARWLNASLFAANILLTGLILKKKLFLTYVLGFRLPLSSGFNPHAGNSHCRMDRAIIYFPQRAQPL